MKKRFALAGAAIGATLALLAGTALAYILVIGVGEATSASHQTKDLTVTVTPPTLIPGDRNHRVVLVVHNPNDHAVQVNQLTAMITKSPGCRIETAVTQPNVTVNAWETVDLSGLVTVSQDARDTRSCEYTINVRAKGDLLGNG